MSTAIAELRIHRRRIFYSHEGVRKRRIVHELTLEHLGANDASDVLLVFREFMVGLRVLDSDGYELPVVPRWLVRQSKLSEVSEEDSPEISGIYSDRSLYPIWIDLPSGRGLRRGEPRVWRFEYTDSDRPSQSWKRLDWFFDSLRFDAGGEKPSSDEFDTYFVIDIPDDSEMTQELTLSALGVSQEALERDLAVIPVEEGLSVVLPHKGFDYRWTLKYVVRATLSERSFWLVFFSVSVLLALALDPEFSAWSGLSIVILPLAPPHRYLIASFFVATIGGLIGLLGSPGLRRTRALFFIPLALFLLVLLVL